MARATSRLMGARRELAATAVGLVLCATPSARSSSRPPQDRPPQRSSPRLFADDGVPAHGVPEYGVEAPGVPARWNWPLVALEGALPARKGQRAAEAQPAAMAAQSAAEAGPDTVRQAEFARERAVANAVLAEPQFRAAGLTWWDRARQKVFEWLQRIFAGVIEVGTAAPWLATLLEWVCCAGAAIGLLFYLLRNGTRQRLRVAPRVEELHGPIRERERGDWAQRAADHAEAGRWREAVHCLYWAAIVLLESRRAWRHNPARTPREYLRLLQPGSAAQQALRRLTRILERVWYGLRETDEREYAEARALYEQLAANAADSAVAASDVAPAAGGAA